MKDGPLIHRKPSSKRGPPRRAPYVFLAVEVPGVVWADHLNPALHNPLNHSIHKIKSHRLLKVIQPSQENFEVGVLLFDRKAATKATWEPAPLQTIPGSTSREPIWDKYAVESVAVTTMQSISGAGYPGVPSLDIVDNVVPYISEEEDKMIIEIKKLFGTEENAAKLGVAASCNRVATIDGHMESVFVRTARKASPEDVKKAMTEFKGLDLPSAPRDPIIVRQEPDRPQTRLDRDAGKGMSVVVGRIRSDEVLGLSYTVLRHNTIRAGAGGAVLVAELCHRNSLI